MKQANRGEQGSESIFCGHGWWKLSNDVKKVLSPSDVRKSPHDAHLHFELDDHVQGNEQ